MLTNLEVSLADMYTGRTVEVGLFGSSLFTQTRRALSSEREGQKKQGNES
jgi:hypothetical protein